LLQAFPGRIFRCDSGKVFDLNPDLYQGQEEEIADTQ